MGFLSLLQGAGIVPRSSNLPDPMWRGWVPGQPSALPGGNPALPPPTGRAVIPYGANLPAAQPQSSQGILQSILKSAIGGFATHPYTMGAAALGAGALGTGAALQSVNSKLARDNLMLDPEGGMMAIPPAPSAPAGQPALPPIPDLGTTPAYGSTPITIGPAGSPQAPGIPGVPLPQPRPQAITSRPGVAAPWVNPDQNFYNGPGSSSFGAGDAAPGLQTASPNFNSGGILNRFFGG